MATSTTKSETGGTVKAFATLRFAGDALEPQEISDILGVGPTLAYRKGERYFAGRRTGELPGRTGIWLLRTDNIVNDPDLSKHLKYLAGLIFESGEDRAARLHEMMIRRELKTDVSCFWHGAAGAQPPTIPAAIVAAFAQLPAEIETDFDAD